TALLTTTSASLFIACRFVSMRPLHPFPTRRSSDLWKIAAVTPGANGAAATPKTFSQVGIGLVGKSVLCGATFGRAGRTLRHRERSEEHTSELQSPDHLVCRLLLEKKKSSYHY